MTTTEETSTAIACPPSEVTDQILPWFEVQEGDAVLYLGQLRQVVHMWPLMVESAPGLFGVRLLYGGRTQDVTVHSNFLTAVRRYTEGTGDDRTALHIAALDEAAADRDVRAHEYCVPCGESAEGMCPEHHEHLDRASEYRAERDRLEAGR